MWFFFKPGYLNLLEVVSNNITLNTYHVLEVR